MEDNSSLLVFAHINEAAGLFLKHIVGLMLRNSVVYFTYHTNLSIVLNLKHVVFAWKPNGYDKVTGLIKVCDVH